MEEVSDCEYLSLHGEMREEGLLVQYAALMAPGYGDSQ
jgi:hypothetical protein